MSNDRHWLSAFLDAHAAELGAAQNTLAAYARDLADFFDCTSSMLLVQWMIF